MTKVFVFFTLLFLYSGQASAEQNSISVFCNEETGKVNKKIFGNNLLGYDPALETKGLNHSNENTDYGSGIWDPQKKCTFDWTMLAG